MELTRICDVLSMMADIELGRAYDFAPVARLAMEEVRGALREGVDENAHRERLIYVAAAVAYYRYAVLEAARERAATVKTGTVSVSTSPADRIAAAKAVRDEFWGMAADLLTDRNFVFGQVK